MQTIQGGDLSIETGGSSAGPIEGSAAHRSMRDPLQQNPPMALLLDLRSHPRYPMQSDSARGRPRVAHWHWARVSSSGEARLRPIYQLQGFVSSCSPPQHGVHMPDHLVENRLFVNEPRAARSRCDREKRRRRVERRTFRCTVSTRSIDLWPVMHAHAVVAGRLEQGMKYRNHTHLKHCRKLRKWRQCRCCWAGRPP